MKTQIFYSVLGVFLMSMLGITHAFSYQENIDDKTLSPYFFVKTDDLELDQLPLKSTSVEVNVSGVIADVVVTQVYKNEGKKPLEAIYVFPASTRAAVYGMKMAIGERTIIAKIREREAARQEYEDAKKAGQSASLLEQQRPNVFQMNVANILPADVISVELRYTELLIPVNGIYEFVYPTVVGPRYSNQQAAAAPSSEKWIQNPYFHQGEPPSSQFYIGLTINAGLPLQDITCTSHRVGINFSGLSIASIKLDSSEKHGGNRDFVLKYRLTGGEIESGLLLYEGKNENYFLLMIQPPRRVTVSQIPPREYMFIVDVSGSMHGFPLDISKKLLRDLIGNLRPTDRFNVLLFAGGSKTMSDRALPATQDNIRLALDLIDRQGGGGATELLPALKKALSMPGTEGFSRNIVIATDGYVTVEEEAFDLIRNGLGDANMFAFGIGSSVNRHIIEGMARVGMGEPFVITRPEDAQVKADKFRELIASPVLTKIKIHYEGFNAFDVEPPGIPDVLAERPVIVFGKYHGKPHGAIELEGVSGDKTFRKTLHPIETRPKKGNSALRYLWARHRIALLSDYNHLRPNDERVKEVTNLGLTHNLLTAYTSFIAVDSQIRLEDGKATTIEQPLPLPQGVSDYAVGKGGVKMGSIKSRALAPVASAKIAMPIQTLKEEAFEVQEGIHSGELSISHKSEERGFVRLGPIRVTGGLSKPDVQKIVEKQMIHIDRCYAGMGKDQTGFTKEAVVKLTVDPFGRVISVHMEKGKINEKGLKMCIENELKKLRFPASEGGKIVEIFISFVYQS